ncbi:MAG: hypothetical protein ACMUHB_03710 [Thermoplasmatota archaeon]
MPDDTSATRNVISRSVPLIVLLFLLPTGAVITGSCEEEAGPGISLPSRGEWLDIAIDDIMIKGPTQSNNHYPGQRLRIDVHLVHDDRPVKSDIPVTGANGNGFTTVLVIDDGNDNVTTLYSDVKSMTTNYTGEDMPGANARFPPFLVTFYWTVPSSPPPGMSWGSFQYSIMATITVDDDDKSDNFMSGKSIRVTQPEFSPFIREDGQREGDPGSPHPHEVAVGGIMIIPIELRNMGPTIDMIGVKIISCPEGWHAEGIKPRVIYPNNFESYPFAVQVSKNPFLARAEDEYTIVAKAYSVLYEGPYLLNSNHFFRFRVQEKASAVVYPEKEFVTLEPGKQSDVRFILRNTGNFKDSYAVTEMIDEVHRRNGWNVDIVKQTRLLSDVPPDEKREIIVAVTVPEDIPYHYGVNLELSVRSVKADFSRRSEPCTLFSDVLYAADIERFEEPVPVKPGRENLIRFNFTNLGNLKDPDQYLEVTHKPFGWWVYIDQTPLKAQKGIGAWTRVNLEMTVFVDETTVTTSREFGLPYIIIQARGGLNEYLLDEEWLYFEIPLNRKVELSTPDMRKDGYLGGQVEFPVEVRNRGNYYDSFNLTVDSEWARFSMDISREVIVPNGSILVTLLVNIPFDVPADTDPDTPLPDLSGRYDGFVICVSAYSQNETRKGSTLTELDLVVHVQPFYNFEIEIDPAESDLRFSMDHDQARTVRLRITNTGNIADTVMLDWEDNPYGTWLSLQSSNVDIAYGETAYVAMTITPRAYTIEKEGTISLMLKGVSKFDPDVENPVTRVLPVDLKFFRLRFDISEIRINNEEFSRIFSGERDRTYAFQVTVENVGTEVLDPTCFEPLEVVLYEDGFELKRSEISYLPNGEVERVVFNWKAATPGRHNFTILLDGDVPISDQGVNLRSFDFLVNFENEPPPRDPYPLELVIVPLMLIVIFSAASAVFIIRMKQTVISLAETGYDESGEYRPWAVKEKLSGRRDRLKGSGDLMRLPPGER